ncbi:hypothetical protein ACFL1Q_03430, partial [Patescibacteria group bacterium]
TFVEQVRERIADKVEFHWVENFSRENTKRLFECLEAIEKIKEILDENGIKDDQDEIGDEIKNQIENDFPFQLKFLKALNIEDEGEIYKLLDSFDRLSAFKSVVIVEIGDRSIVRLTEAVTEIRVVAAYFGAESQLPLGEDIIIEREHYPDLEYPIHYISMRYSFEDKKTSNN